MRAFEDLGTPLWAERTRAELARTNVSPGADPGLTPSERRVAELAASGMTNREVASAMFISPIALPLLGFNVGIELGQVVVLVVAFVLLTAFDRAISKVQMPARGLSPFRLRVVAVSLAVALVAIVKLILRAKAAISPAKLTTTPAAGARR